MGVLFCFAGEQNIVSENTKDKLVATDYSSVVSDFSHLSFGLLP